MLKKSKEAGVSTIWDTELGESLQGKGTAQGVQRSGAWVKARRKEQRKKLSGTFHVGVTL